MRRSRAVAASPFVRILVVRSANPAGFCTGLHSRALASLVHPTDRAAFAWYGQQVFDRLARLDAVSLAFIDGPCLNAGLELALACDHRLCVARSITHLGFPERLACFGGSARLTQLGGRRAMGLLTSGRNAFGPGGSRSGTGRCRVLRAPREDRTPHVPGSVGAASGEAPSARGCGRTRGGTAVVRYDTVQACRGCYWLARYK